ncbi:MAG TPA: DUF5317 domain-containing protein [Gudongella oleilytica]|nr:DUF5317 domain-containing protein [Gudongella oleilytica]
MFLEPSVLSIALAKLRGGKIKNLEKVSIKGYWMFILAAILQGALSFGKLYKLPLVERLTGDWLVYVMLLTYTVMLITVIINYEKSYMKLFFIGLLLNMAVILWNDGRMPVSMDGIQGIGQETVLPDREMDIKHVAVDKDTRLVWLADIILIPKPYPLPKIISIGDIFIMGGVFLFFQKEMLASKRS